MSLGTVEGTIETLGSKLGSDEGAFGENIFCGFGVDPLLGMELGRLLGNSEAEGTADPVLLGYGEL